MQLTPATFTQLALCFGQNIKRAVNATDEAAGWLWPKRSIHQEVLVQACNVPALTPIGVKRIDAMLSCESQTGFMSGNVSSNVQTSLIIPPYSSVQVNGFTKLDRQGASVTSQHHDASGPLEDIPPGYLQRHQLALMRSSAWNSMEDRHVLGHIAKLLDPDAGVVGPDEATTVVRVMHMRSKETRQSYPTPIITHGWLLIGDRGQLHYEHCISPKQLSHKMMARAKMALTCERYDTEDRLRIEGGKILFVHEDVLQHLQSQGHDITSLDLSLARTGRDEMAQQDQLLDDTPAP